MKYLIIGLGNPGAEYENTRHNIGFKVLDKLASLSNISFSTNKLADVTEVKFKGRKLILIKPNTFMNLSGKSVHYWMQQSKVNIDNILVITDDISLPFGVLRLRKKGSDGGHNGLKDIQLTLGTDAYPKLRFGIGNDFKKGQQIDFVLGKWNTGEKKIVELKIEKSVEVIESFASIGLSRTMTMANALEIVA